MVRRLKTTGGRRAIIKSSSKRRPADSRLFSCGRGLGWKNESEGTVCMAEHSIRASRVSVQDMWLFLNLEERHGKTSEGHFYSENIAPCFLDRWQFIMIDGNFIHVFSQYELSEHQCAPRVGYEANKVLKK